MKPPQSSLDLIFGIGFKIGVLMVLFGILIAYFPILDATLREVLDISGIWNAFLVMPEYLKIIIVGVVFMGVAVILSVAKDLIKDTIKLVFFEDKDNF